MKKNTLIVIGIIGALCVLGIAKISTDAQMKAIVVEEVAEKEAEIESLVTTGHMPEKTGWERKIEVDGLENMRDMGGVRGSYGQVEEDMLYRSETLYYLTDEGLEQMNDMGFDTIIDFRGADEIEHHPNRMPEGARYINLAVTNPAEIDELIPKEHQAEIRQAFLAGDIDRFNELLEHYDINLGESKLERYVEFSSLWNEEFSRFMHILLEDGSKRVLFHCEGGKDRTGYAAALFYKTLGVSEDKYIEDFLLTNDFTAEKNAPIIAKMPESLLPTIIADAAHLKASFNYIDDTYGDFDTFRRDVLKISDVEKEALIEKYID